MTRAWGTILAGGEARRRRTSRCPASPAAGAMAGWLTGSALALPAALALALLVVAAPARAQQPAPSVHRPDLYGAWMGDGAAQEAAGKWKSAAASYQRALSYRPGDPTALFRRAFCLDHTGDAAGAGKLLHDLLAQPVAQTGGTPPQATLTARRDAALLLADLLTHKGAAAEAAAVVEKELALQPNDPKLLLAAGQAWLYAGVPTKAVPLLNHAATAGAPASQVQLLLGQAYLTAGKPDRAEEPLHDAYLNGVADAGLPLAEVYLAEKRWLEAVALAQSITQAHPQDPQAWWVLAQGYVNLADTAHASDAMTKAVTLSPLADRRTMWLKSAKLALAAALPEVVLQIAKTAPVAPDPEVLGLQAQAHEALAQWSDAGQTWEQAAMLKPVLLREATRCWLQAGDKTRALICIERLAQQDPSALADAAKLALALGHAATAEHNLRQLLALAPDNAQVQVALAELLEQTGFLGLAARQVHEAGLLGQTGSPGLAARQVHEASADTADAWRALAMIYARAEMADAAAQACLKAWQISKGDADAANAAAMLRHAGRWDEVGSVLTAARREDRADTSSPAARGEEATAKAEVGKSGQAPKSSVPYDSLQLEAARLALHENKPGSALKDLAKSTGPVAAELKALALNEAGRRADACAAIEKAWVADAGVELPRLAAILRRSAGDSDARREALEVTVRLLYRGPVHPSLLDALDALLGAEFGQGRVPARLQELGAVEGAPWPLLQHAALALCAAGKAKAARDLVAPRLKTARPADAKVRALALAAKVEMDAGDTAQAAEYLAQAAALKGEGAVVAQLALVKHAGHAEPEVQADMGALTDAWMAGEGGGQALLDFMRDRCQPAGLTAWASQFKGPAADQAVVRGGAALAAGNANLSLAILAGAPQTPATLRLQVRALIEAGQAAEADGAVDALLRAGPTADDLALVGNVAGAAENWGDAAWWYAKAIAAGAFAAAIGPQLSAAAERAGMTTPEREDLIDQVCQSLPASEQSKPRKALGAALGLQKQKATAAARNRRKSATSPRPQAAATPPKPQPPSPTSKAAATSPKPKNETAATH